MHLIMITSACGKETWREWYSDGHDAAREVRKHMVLGRKVRLINSEQERPKPDTKR